MVELDLRGYVVEVNKLDVARGDMTDGDLYCIALFRLLDELNAVLEKCDKQGMVMFDSRSDHHSAVQDRRVINAYLRWATRHEAHRFVERPWFGFSSFYPGLQLADFVAYMMDTVREASAYGGEVAELKQAIAGFTTRCTLIHIP